MSDTTAGDAQPSESAAPAAGIDPAALSVEQVRLALRKVKDPELNLNIVDLGLVYDIRVEGARAIIDMSLTSPGCPSGPARASSRGCPRRWTTSRCSRTPRWAWTSWSTGRSSTTPT